MTVALTEGNEYRSNVFMGIFNPLIHCACAILETYIWVIVALTEGNEYSSNVSKGKL